MKPKQYLFSYGTLQPGQAPPEIAEAVSHLHPVGQGKIRGRLYDLGEYPAAILSDSGPEIVGRVLELPDDPKILTQLDEYEGFDSTQPAGSLFVREKRLVTMRGGRKIRCWVYRYNRHPGSAPSLTNGNFLKSRNQPSR